MTEFPCDVCAAGAGPVRCAGCGSARCEEHLLLEVTAGQVGHTYMETHMEPGPIVHVTPQGQPIHSPPWIPVQIPVTVQVPVLSATTHRGTVTNYPYPGEIDGRSLSERATRAAAAQWTGPKRVCVWCRESAARDAAAATTETERLEAEEEARRQARRQAEEREARRLREEQRRVEHAELVARRRREYGPDQAIRTRIAALRKVEANRPRRIGRGPLERFFEALPDWLALVFPFVPFGLGWWWGSTMVEQPAEGGVPFLTPLPLALGIAATLLVFGPSTIAVLWQKVDDPRRERRAGAARAERRRLEGQLGCGRAGCELCGSAT